MKNAGLNQAKKARKDCFYTMREDVEKEIRFYEGQFVGQTVYCNCDDETSAFWRVFKDNFEALGLKRLICTHWNENGRSYKAEFDGEEEFRTPLERDGDYRSEECVEILKESDIIVSNPPFSLFLDYMNTLIRYKKKCLILGPMTGMKSKVLFPLFMDNRMQYGPSITGGDRKFLVPDDYPLNAAGCGIDDAGRRFIRVKGVRWFTNLNHGVDRKPLALTEMYDPKRFPKFDNIDAINVPKTAEIPNNYRGVMGVPISFIRNDVELRTNSFHMRRSLGSPVDPGQRKAGTLK